MLDDYTFEENWNKPIRRKKMYTGFALDIDDECLEEKTISREQKSINKNHEEISVKILVKTRKKRKK